MFALFVLALVASAQALDFQHGLNVSDVSKDFEFRWSNMTGFSDTLPVPIIGNVGIMGGAFCSFNAAGAASVLDGNPSAALGADSIFALALVANPGLPPIMWYSSFDLAIDLRTTLNPNNIASLLHPQSITLNFNNTGASLVGSAYLWIKEYDTNGNVVKTCNLTNTDNIFSSTTVSAWTFAEGQSQNGYLQWVSFQSTFQGATINLTTMTTAVAGVTDLANTVVGPRVVETVVQINNWPYASTNNYVVLTMASVNAKATVDGQAVASAGGAFFAVNTEAYVDGHPTGVHVGNWDASAGAVAQFEASAAYGPLKAMVAGVASASAEAHLVDITFPKAAKQITYDPAVGTGSWCFCTSPSAASATSVGLFVLFAALLAHLF